MKAFVSGQLDEKELIRDLFIKLQGIGIAITHDWTTTDYLEKPYSLNPEEAGKRAASDIQGVRDADIYILMTNNKTQGKGMYVELGAALVLALSQGRPEILIIGPKNRSNIDWVRSFMKSKGFGHVLVRKSLVSGYR